MTNKFQIKSFTKKVEKPWGYEIIITPENSKIVGKIHFIRAGKRSSLQYHTQKNEVLSSLSGKVVIWLEDDKGKIIKKVMAKKRGYFIVSGQKHRFEAKQNSFIMEVSDQETGETIRVDDDYQRKNETEIERKKIWAK